MNDSPGANERKDKRWLVDQEDEFNLGSTGNEWLLLPDHWLVLAFRDLLMQDARTQAEARAPAKKEKSASASANESK